MKGQITFEFLGTVLMALLIYGVFYIYIISMFAGMLPWDTQSYEAGFYAERIGENINYAYAAGDGYYSSFELPEQIRGRDYTVYYSNESKAVEVDIIDLGEIDSYGIAYFTAPTVGIYDVGNGTNKITNSNGTVIIWR